MMNEQQQQQIHPAAAACEFMQRAELKGKEVEIFAQTYNWLQAILAGELEVKEVAVEASKEDGGNGVAPHMDNAAVKETLEAHGVSVEEEPMEVTPENEPVGEDIPILSMDDDPQGATDPAQL